MKARARGCHVGFFLFEQQSDFAESCYIGANVLLSFFISFLTAYIGGSVFPALLLLLLVTLWALRRHGCGVLMMALPTLCYNLGTMFLLCGNDARFFQFSMTVSMAMMLAMMYLPGEEMHKCR